MTERDAAAEPHQTAYELTDPYAWLEEVEGEAQLAWVRERNEQAEEALAGSERFASLRAGSLEVLDSSEKIPTVVQRGDHLYNFWTDAEHERGLWRRTSWASYRTADPDWETLIDLDALNAAEGANWVWGGATVLKPQRTRALVALSRGGADAKVYREFDLTTRTWVPGGFELPEAKGSMSWADSSGDLVYVATDFGPGSMTTSGYPRTVRRWRRGEPLEQATELFAAESSDMAVGAMHDFTPGFERDLIYRYRGFYDAEFYLLMPDDSLVKLDVPRSSQPALHREWLTLTLREEWALANSVHPAGSLLAIDLEQFLAGERDFTVLFTPTDSISLAAAVWTRSQLVLNLLTDVVSHLRLVTPPTAPDGVWGQHPVDLGDAPSTNVTEPHTLQVGAIDAEESDGLWLYTTGFLTPTTLRSLELGDGGAVTVNEALKAQPSFFDTSGMSVTQQFTTSADGTRVPYFQVTPAGFKGDEPAPTLLYGYGGFEISLAPSYSGIVGRAWLERGGVYVVANIRGGGEYGPAWHRAALKENRHRAYEDFAAVAEDLIARGVTDAAHLGARGGSNGGLLMGNMLVRYPHLFGAITSQVPLLDMKRYSHLLAGASWMAEYGDPDDPEQWEYIRTFSPYHLFDEATAYPPVLFTTSTRDDRVHPGHARKMAAKMLAAGDNVTYYENIEGGHGGAASNAQASYLEALAYEFLWRCLGRSTQ